MLANLHYVKELGYRSRELLEAGSTREFGLLMHEHWEHKKRRSGGMSNPRIDEWYELGLANGAVGGKLVGAGGGGFLLFYADDRNASAPRHEQGRAGGSTLRFRFRRHEGTVLVTLPVAILAGGLATRLHPVTETLPKALVPVAGEPFAFHQLRLLARRVSRRAVFLVGYLGERIVEAVGDGRRFGVEVDYVFRTGRSFSVPAAPSPPPCPVGDAFFVLYGDSYLECDYLAAEKTFLSCRKPALMTSLPQRRTVGHQQCRYSTRPHPALQQGRAHATDAPHRLWPRCLPQGCLRRRAARQAPGPRHDL